MRFDVVRPDVDETPQPDESPPVLAARLATSKAEAASLLLDSKPSEPALYPPSNGALIIGSDQVASIEGQLLGKPGSFENACNQLERMSGRTAEFYTALTILDTVSCEQFTALDVTRVTLRPLDNAEIKRYVQHDNPLDCAGSFKMESLGISLFDSIETQDPTALIGLPMLSISKGLRHFGVQLP